MYYLHTFLYHRLTDIDQIIITNNSSYINLWSNKCHISHWKLLSRCTSNKLYHVACSYSQNVTILCFLVVNYIWYKILRLAEPITFESTATATLILMNDTLQIINSPLIDHIRHNRNILVAHIISTHSHMAEYINILILITAVVISGEHSLSGKENSNGLKYYLGNVLNNLYVLLAIDLPFKSVSRT